jgi:L-ascorbate metabolism protein UlaG (beta-lactamase superfamily)
VARARRDKGGTVDVDGMKFTMTQAQHLTMSPKEAALALELLGVSRCVPGHYGTFPVLTGTPNDLRRLAPDVEVLSPEPGETIEL